jgi:acyl-coenzyme A thioesterase PaaI-like protein
MLAQLGRKLSKRIRPQTFARLWSLWPPFLGAGIRIDRISKDFREIDVSMRLTARNSNYVGTHFGGSLYAMTDPFYMIMIIQNLGKEFIVWDKSAAIKFIKPGKGKVSAQFRLEAEDLAKINAGLESSPERKFLFEKEVQVRDENTELVATVMKVVYIRAKSAICRR